MRSKLRTKYLRLLEHRPHFCFESKDVLVNLWKFVFYKQIEFCRKRLRSRGQYAVSDETKRSELRLKLTQHIIPDAQSVYNELIDKHLSKAKISRRQSASSPPSSSSSSPPATSSSIPSSTSF